MSTKTSKTDSPKAGGKTTRRAATTGRFTNKSATTNRRGDNAIVDLDVEVVRDSRGRRITEADAAQLAEDAIAKVVGRPSLTGAGQKSPQVSFRVSADTRRRAEELAAAEGKTVSELAREALEARVRAAQLNG